MKLHQIKKSVGSKSSRQVGRGGKRGYTSGRGSKGQKSRAGHKIRPAIRDMIKKIPKQRGYRFSARVKPQVVNLALLEKVFENKAEINPNNLLNKGLIRRQGGKIRAVKVLGHGNITKSFFFSNCTLSATAGEKIMKVGGEIKN